MRVRSEEWRFRELWTQTRVRRWGELRSGEEGAGEVEEEEDEE